MNTAPRMYKPAAITAALLMSLMQVVDIAAAISLINSGSVSVSMTGLPGELLITVLLVVVLLRGRKDAFAGVVFLFSLVPPVLSAGFQLLSVLAGFELVHYAAASALSALLVVIFRALAAGECLTRGRLSASAGRRLLWVTPVLCFLSESLAQIFLYLAEGLHPGEIGTGILVYVLPRSLPHILMGVALSKQVKENM